MTTLNTTTDKFIALTIVKAYQDKLISKDDLIAQYDFYVNLSLAIALQASQSRDRRIAGRSDLVSGVATHLDEICAKEGVDLN